MKQEASFFEGHEAALIYIAKRLKDALRLESIFDAAGLDYGVEADEYRSGVVFRSARAGAFFYVLPPAVETAHEVLVKNGFKPYEGDPIGTPEE
jgi:hypothetical protein